MDGGREGRNVKGEGGREGGREGGTYHVASALHRVDDAAATRTAL